MAEQGTVHIGTSGWIYPHWRGLFYPTKLPVKHWFAYYGRTFDTVEINNTFYRLPRAEVFEEWRRQAPPGFVYAVKASRFLTHFKKLGDPEEALQNLLGRARGLGPHLGPVLYQLPPHWRCDAEKLRRFLALLPRDVQHVFEFRDPSWYNAHVENLLREAGVGFCIHDLRGASCPRWITGPVAYRRFHGPSTEAYAGCYTDEQLHQAAREVQDLRACAARVYVYFNNDPGGHAVANARALRQLLGLQPASAEHALSSGPDSSSMGPGPGRTAND